MSNVYSLLGVEDDLKATYDLLHERYGVVEVYGRRQGRIYVTKEPVSLEEQEALNLVHEHASLNQRTH